MKNNVLITIIIPTYNRANTIINCLQSICSQNLEQIEIIIIDDASTDNTLKVLQDYIVKTNFKIVVINLSKNLGPGNARNEGILHAKGEFITFIDSDDTVEENYVKTIIEAILNHNCDLFIFKYQRKFIRKGNLIEKIYPYSGKKIKEHEVDDLNVLYTKVEASSVIKVIKKKIIIDNPEVKFSNYKVGEDLVFSLKLYYHIKSFIILPNILYNYHLYDKSLSRQVIHIKEYLKILEEIVMYYKNHDAFTQKHDVLEYILTKHLILPNLLKFYNNKTNDNYQKFLLLRSRLIDFFPEFDKNNYFKKEPFYVRTIIKIVKYRPKMIKYLIQ